MFHVDCTNLKKPYINHAVLTNKRINLINTFFLSLLYTCIHTSRLIIVSIIVGNTKSDVYCRSKFREAKRKILIVAHGMSN